MSVEQLLSTCTVPTTWTLLSFESLIFLRELEFEDYGQLTRCFNRYLANDGNLFTIFLTR
jgi:hypothetical protein